MVERSARVGMRSMVAVWVFGSSMARLSLAMSTP